MDEKKLLEFDYQTESPKIIKVIGVGGGGGNAVSNMYREGIRDVSFVLCNTDNQAMQKSAVPNKLLLGKTITQGLGAGNNPEKGEAAAVESEDEIRNMLNDGTRMAFITAGMGGGTGTGAAPIVAKVSKDMGILTVGIVTIPFLFEGEMKINKALKGLRNMEKNVDSLLVINNQRVMDFDNMTISEANRKVDTTLTIAAKSISEIITTDLEQNVDFADVDTTMRNSGVALVSVGYGEGEGRLQQAIDEALGRTLVNDVKNVFHGKRVAFVIYYSHESELRAPEFKVIHKFMEQFKTQYEVKWGYGFDDTLGNKIKITLLVTGFGLSDILTNNEQQVMLTEEERRLAAEQEEARRKAQEEQKKLFDQYYGEFIDPRANIEVVILSPEELDDDVLITLLEETPTYKRDPKKIAQARGRMSGIAEEVEGNAVAPESPVTSQLEEKKQTVTGQQIISFKEDIK